MIAEDLYVRRKRANIKTRELVPRLPELPNGRRIALNAYGEIERGERDIEPVVYENIITTIDTIAKERAEKSAA